MSIARKISRLVMLLASGVTAAQPVSLPFSVVTTESTAQLTACAALAKSAPGQRWKTLQRLAAARGVPVRILNLDGEAWVATQELNRGRLNVEVARGTVKTAHCG